MTNDLAVKIRRILAAFWKKIHIIAPCIMIFFFGLGYASSVVHLKKLFVNSFTLVF